MWGTSTPTGGTTHYGIATLTNMESAGYMDETGTKCCTWEKLSSWYEKNINGSLPPHNSQGSMTNNTSVISYNGGRYINVLGYYPLDTLFGKSRKLNILFDGYIYSLPPSNMQVSSDSYKLYITFSNSTQSWSYGTDEIPLDITSYVTRETLTSVYISKEITLSKDDTSLDVDLSTMKYMLLIAIPTSYGYQSAPYIGVGSNYTSYVNIYTYALDKCLRGDDFQRKSVTRPWVYRISEGVSGATRARTVTGRLAYKTSSSSSYSTIDIGTWTSSSNITDGASSTVWTKCNLYNILGVNDISSYTTRLWFWCGTTKNNQKWYGYYRTRTKSTGGLGTTWSSAVDLTGSGSKGTSIIYGNDSQDFPFYTYNFKYCMQNYCGVTCRPE